MNKIIYLILLILITSCTNLKEKAGLVKYQPDEYQVTTNPPLTVPPNFDIQSPEELMAKKNSPEQEKDNNLSKGENLILQNINQ
ncbi:MAG: DUF3035 domain-containing protein [Rickettsiales bacterium]|jgi:hypothetical protein|nr:DUF3035 domain-containing protein [Rickettsiales bacterium]